MGTGTGVTDMTIVGISAMVSAADNMIVTIGATGTIDMIAIDMDTIGATGTINIVDSTPRHSAVGRGKPLNARPLFFFLFFLYHTSMKKFVTTSKTQTQKLGEALAKELRGGEVLCLSGNLGSGKTTLVQGMLKGLRAKGPYTSPTFVVMKKYNFVYHIDAYRIKSADLLSLGWKELVGNKKNIVLVEWAERVKKIIPRNAVWIRFKWLDEHTRELTFS